MKQERRKVAPSRLPVSVLDIGTILSDPAVALLRQDLLQRGPFFRRAFRARDDSTIAIFIPRDMEPLLTRDGIMLLVDDTYKTVPGVRHAYQLLTVHAVEYEEEAAEVSFCFS